MRPHVSPTDLALSQSVKKISPLYLLPASIDGGKNVRPKLYVHRLAACARLALVCKECDQNGSLWPARALLITSFQPPLLPLTA